MTETGAEQDSVPDQRWVRIIARDRVLDGFMAVDRYTVVHDRYDGRPSELLARLVLERGDAAAVLPYDPETKRLVLIEQFRLPAFVRGNHGWLWELIAGVCEPGRTPEQVAHSEALEEAGLRLGPLVPLMTIFPSPGGSSERIFLFWSDLRQAEQVASGGGLPESGEDIRVGMFTLAQSLDMVRSGEIVDAKTIVALQCLALAGEAIR